METAVHETAQSTADVARPVVAGICEPGFAGVRVAFERNFTEHRELGASVCVRVHGRTVVDLWGGIADPCTGQAWDSETVNVIFSATKGAAATCVHLLAARGALDITAPVAQYWPEFARRGKDRITVHEVLTHRTGVSAVRTPLPDGILFEPEAFETFIAAEAPFFPPGTRHGYAAMTYGFILDALVRRVDGRPLGRYFAEELAGPLGLDFWIGAPPETEPRIAPMIPAELDPTTAAEYFLAAADPKSLPGLQFGNGGGYHAPGPCHFDSPTAHGAAIPSTGGITNARGLAGLYEPLAHPGTDFHGIRFDPDNIAAMSTAHSAGWDESVRINTRFGLGYMLAVDNRWRPPRERDSLIIGPNAFGHPGFGGAIGFADPDHGLSYGYTMNRMSPALTIGRRSQALVDATYRALGASCDHSGAWR